MTSLPLLEALRLMIALSDNDATNAVLDRADLLATGDVDRLLADVPTRNTAAPSDDGPRGRGRPGEPDLPGGPRRPDGDPPRGRLLGPDLTRLALEILREQQFGAGLPAYRPAGVAAASKTGDLPGLRADMAILERGERWVAVAVLADELPTRTIPGDRIGAPRCYHSSRRSGRS